MSYLALLLLLLFAVLLAMGAPTINSATLRQNAIDAQILNSEFRTLKDTDPCDGKWFAKGLSTNE
jgi:hypothetical protein